MIIQLTHMPNNEIPNFTERQLDVMKLIVEGHSSSEIADKLEISENTVITHRKKILIKFKVKNTAGLVREAIRFKIYKFNSLSVE